MSPPSPRHPGGCFKDGTHYSGSWRGADTLAVTDDIEIELKDGTSVKLKSRKYGGLNRRSSRPGVKARLAARGKSAEPAGLDIHGQLYSPDVDATFEVYKTFEIEFESSPSK